MSTDISGEDRRGEINRRALATDHLMADLGRRTARGGAIAIGAQVIRMALQFGTMAVLARLLAPGDFGLVAMAAVVTGFVGMFTDLGLSAATVQRREIDQDTVSALFLMNLGMGVLVMLALFALAPAAAWFFDDERVLWIVIALALPVPLMAASRQHAALLQRGMRWMAIEWTGVAAQAAAAAVAIAVALMTDLGYWALVAQSWTAALLTLVLSWAVCPWRPSRVRSWQGARAALGFGLNLTAFNFLNYFHRQFDDLLVGWRWGAVDLGYYNRAYALLTLPIQLINGPVGAAVIPALSRLQDNSRAWTDLYRSALQATVYFAAPFAFLLILLAPEIVRVLYGPGWDEAAAIFQVLSISMVAQPVMSSTGWLWVSAGATRDMLIWAAFSIPIMILGMILGLPYGAKGVAAGYSLSILALTPLCTWFAARTLPISVTSVYRAIAVPVLAAAVAFAPIHLFFAEAGGMDMALVRAAAFLGVYIAITSATDPSILRRVLAVARSLAEQVSARKANR